MEGGAGSDACLYLPALCVCSHQTTSCHHTSDTFLLFSLPLLNTFHCLLVCNPSCLSHPASSSLLATLYIFLPVQHSFLASLLPFGDHMEENYLLPPSLPKLLLHTMPTCLLPLAYRPFLCHVSLSHSSCLPSGAGVEGKGACLPSAVLLFFSIYICLVGRKEGKRQEDLKKVMEAGRKIRQEGRRHEKRLEGKGQEKERARRERGWRPVCSVSPSILLPLPTLLSSSTTRHPCMGYSQGLFEALSYYGQAEKEKQEEELL